MIRYSELGTIGDENGYITCCMAVAREWNKASTIKPYPQFELAAEALKENKLSCILVPAAYPNISEFIMDNHLKVAESFTHRIPHLVLVGKQVERPDKVEAIFHHPATKHLLVEVGMSYDKALPTSSNSVACKELLSYSGPSAAITNSLCADYYNLKVLKVLREGIDMPFVCFVKK